MRYEKGRKDETRQRVVAAASRLFRRDGVDGTGVAGLMAEVGLTHGGFYAHFKSKEDLVREALAASLAAARATLESELETARRNGTDGLEAFVQRYLRREHCDKPEAGCAVAALAPEIGRHDPAMRDAIMREIEATIGLIASELARALPEEAARDTASAIFGLMIGTLQLARITPDPDRAESILRSGRTAALALVRQGH
jgi:TetR/AcrR family transcriptional repressor of nem operon